MSQVSDIRNRLSEKRARDIVALREKVERLTDGLRTIASGELATIEEAMNYANTLVLSESRR